MRPAATAASGFCRAFTSVAVELDQPLVADPEVVRDLVEDDAADLAAEALRIVAVEPFERPAVDRDPVGRHDA